jgi:hypothetical protein
MTFRAERYPKDWKAIAAGIRMRANNACECAGQCGDHTGVACCAPNGVRIWREADVPSRWALEEDVGRLHPFEPFCDGGPVKVIITVAHLDHDEANNDPSNLLACCQRCHLRLDARDNRARRAVSRALEHPSLPGLAPVYRRGAA